MEIMGKSYMLVTSESERDLIHFVCLPKLRDSVLVNFNMVTSKLITLHCLILSTSIK